jgi:hypothetical protein
MNSSYPAKTLTDALPQRLAGAVLVLIACVLIVFDAAGISINPNASSLLFLSVVVIVAFAILRTPGGMTSLIGLFFLATVLFVAGRPVFALLTQDDAFYSITFGATYAPGKESIYRLMAFWTTGVASLFGGYFLFFGRSSGDFPACTEWHRTYCKQSFVLAFVIVAALLPVMAWSKLGAFASGGYTALYLNQAQYSFDFTRFVELLCPLLYALSVIICEKRYSRMMLVAILAYVVTGALVGQRMQAGLWLLVVLWHFATIRRKPIGVLRLLIGLAIVGCALESIELLREGTVAAQPLLLQLFISQGITFMLPGLSWQLLSPPMHTILGSFLPMGAFYSLLGIGTAETSSIGVYVSSQSNPLLFQSGSGLGSSLYMEVFYACGQVMALYAAACGLLGFLLRKWEKRASRSRVALFFLCACLTSLFAAPRGSFNAVSSQVIYLSGFMIATYLLSLSPTVLSVHAIPTERLYGEN